jgi:diaminopimelate decarboxylase
MQQKVPKLCLFPETADIENDHLILGGCDSVELAATFGTPLYVFDELTLRRKGAEFKREFGQRHANSLVIYACKAFINRALALVFKQEGLGLDIVSGGELSIAQSVAFPPERVYFHGNNKTAEELQRALEWGIGRIVVDNFHELSLLNELAQGRGVSQDILLRLSPEVDPHTHRYTTTGILDSKFGFPVTGQAERAVVEALERSNLNLIGVHFHLGSPVFEVEPYQQAIDIALDFAAEMKAKHGFELGEFNPGGGFAIQYTQDMPAPPVGQYAEVITSRLLAKSQEHNMAPPRLVVEPGRGVVGQAGVALYKAGATKDIPGIRKYISVDGGIADNIRPALYGSRYEALVANKAGDRQTERVTIAGKFCQSGDILIRDIDLPLVSSGDIIAVPSCGAYCLAMASNYNSALKPAIVLVKEGGARLIRRRETYEDLVRRDLVLEEEVA